MSYKLKMVELGSLYSAIAFSPSDLPFVQPMLPRRQSLRESGHVQSVAHLAEPYPDF